MIADVDVALDGGPSIIVLVNRSGELDEAWAKVLIPFVFTDLIFNLPKLLVDGLQGLDQCRLNAEIQLAQGCLQGFEFLGAVLLSLATQLVGFDCQDCDLVNQLTQ